MQDIQDKRQKLLGKLTKGLLYSTPFLVAGIGLGQIASVASAAPAGFEQAAGEAKPAAPEAMGEAKAKGEAEAKKAMGEAKGEAKGEAEVQPAAAEAKGEGEAKGEAEAQPAAAEAKGEGEAKGEAEAQPAAAEAKGEGEAKGEAEGEAKGEAEAEGNPKHVKRGFFSRKYKGALKGDHAALAARGKELYNDASLSTNGLSCNSCHTDMAAYNDTFKNPYPHYVAMGKDIYGLKKITAETMVQLCMEQPMETKALAWDSEELAALSTYVQDVQAQYASKTE